MPTYEYRCKSCGEELEAVQSFTDDPLTDCPACGGPLRKVFGSIGITFKGSGFYKTDSRAGSSSKSSSSSSSSSDGAKSDGASTSDTPKKDSTTSDSGSSSSDSGSKKDSGSKSKSDSGSSTSAA